MLGARLRACAFCVAVALPFALGAQELSQGLPSPILTLDQERLFNGSRVAERVVAETERRTAELTAENRRIEEQLVAEELELTERRPSLPPDEFRALADAFDAKVQGIRAAQDAKARELQRLQDEERQNFLRRITPVLAEIVRERGAVVVLDRRSVLLSAEAIDITDEAIARINEVLDQAATQTPAPAPEAVPEPAPAPENTPVDPPQATPETPQQP
ncbi:MAG: OmpH family outer membrane protein [Rhodobacter sp.]|nr:OmpH family outer membrane protein [Rhodobacter sp.]